MRNRLADLLADVSMDFPVKKYADEAGREIYDPTGPSGNRVLKPDPEIYDGKGACPFSEPETQLIRDCFARHTVKGFLDFHVMNPWQGNNTDYISRLGNGPDLAGLVDAGIAKVNARHSGAALPATRHMVMDEYDGGAPYSVNWARNTMGVPAYCWETGTGLPEELWTDAYMEILCRAISWIDSENG